VKWVFQGFERSPHPYGMDVHKENHFDCGHEFCREVRAGMLHRDESEHGSRFHSRAARELAGDVRRRNLGRLVVRPAKAGNALLRDNPRWVSPPLNTRHGSVPRLILISIQRRGFSRSLLIWLRHLGGPGLILLGLLDNSVVPVPGSMDALTVVLAANQRDWWPYYAAMATVGSLIGGYLTYRIARREGKERLETRLSRGKMKKVEGVFGRWGFGAIAIAAVLPPPAPMVPFLLAAGATQYPRKKFLAALAIGRSVRYGVLAFLAAIYGRRILRVILQHGRIVVMIILVCVSTAIVIFLLLRRGKNKAERRA
jgi:membrane protein DedA with SNARE-associated domain